MEYYQVNCEENKTVEENPILATAYTAVDLKLFKVLMKKMNVATIIMFISSIFFIGLWLSDYFVLQNKKLTLLIGFCATLGCSIFFLLYKAKMKKLYLKGTIHYFTFYKNYLLMKTFTNDEEVSSSTIKYTDIVKKKHVPLAKEAGYLILYYQSRFVPVYVDLQAIRPEQISILQDIFKIQLQK